MASASGKCASFDCKEQCAPGSIYCPVHKQAEEAKTVPHFSNTSLAVRPAASLIPSKNLSDLLITLPYENDPLYVESYKLLGWGIRPS